MAGTCATLKSWTWRNVYAGSIYNDHGFLWLEEPKGKVFYLERGKYILQVGFNVATTSPFHAD